MKVRVLMNVPIGALNAPTDEMVEHGYVEVDKLNDHDDAEYCWHLCNWSCWSDEKPGNLFSDVDVCNHGIVFINPETEVWYLALSNGWISGNEEKIMGYIREHHSDTFWVL